MANPVISQPVAHSHVVRLPVIDVLRGTAILAVFAFHYFGLIYGWDFYRWDGPWRDGHVLGVSADPLLFPITWGWCGVSLFFVLSGFVIHHQTLSRPGFSTGLFLWRRFVRIAPAYYCCLLAVGLLHWVTPFEWSGQKQYLTHALFVHNWFPDTFFGINGPFWSLAAEMQFYLAYPLVVWCRRRVGMGGVLLGAAALSLGCRAVFSFWAECDYPITSLWASFPVLWVDWLLGAWVAERFRAGKFAFPGSFWLPASVLAFVLAGTWKPTNCLSFSFASLASAVVLDRVIRRDWTPGWAGRVMCHVGLISYSMYLWHDPVMEVTHRWLGKQREHLPLSDGWMTLLFALITVMAVWLVSVVSHRWIEDPKWIWRGSRKWANKATLATSSARVRLHNVTSHVWRKLLAVIVRRDPW